MRRIGFLAALGAVHLAVACAPAAAAERPIAAAAAPKAIGVGAWSYFGDPRAVHAGGRTFVGWSDRHGYTHVAALGSGQVLEHRRLGPRLTVDDHNNPSLYVRPDGRLTVFYSAHNGKRMYYRVAAEPNSLMSLSSARVVGRNTGGPWGYTYPNPLTVDGRTWLIFRGANWQPSYVVDRGGWSRARTLVRGPRAPDGVSPVAPGHRHRPYAKYDSDGSRVHGVFTEGNLGAAHNSIWYAQFDAGGIYTAGGRRIAKLGSAPGVRRLERVRGYGGASQWALDVAVDDQGRPVIVYMRRARLAEYWYARFDGKRWRNHLIARYAGNARRPGPVGGVTLDHEDPSTVYLARLVTPHGRHDVEVWVTPDGGDTWRHRAVTDSSSRDDLRPVSPRGLRDFEQVIWFSGTRATWTSFRTNVLVSLIPARFRDPLGS